jgi:superfamily II DNA/RNA helicase
MDQRARMTMLSNFRDGRLKLLVASDVAARGLDIPDVSHVFNYDVPVHAEDYVHRIGRTARAGRSGKAFTIATRSDAKHVDAIEKLIGQKIEWHNGDLSSLAAGTEEDEAPRGRSRSAPRGRASGGRRGRGGHAEERPQQSEIVSAEALDERRQRKEAIRKQNAGRTGEGHRSPEARRDHGHRDAGRPRSYRDDEVNTTVGFGEDMPAFMKVAVKV